MLEELVGKKIFIRTVTNYLVGKVEVVEDGFIRLSGASWIARTARFSQTIKQGELDEVEPVGDAYVSIGSIVDIFPWVHELPTKQQ